MFKRIRMFFAAGVLTATMTLAVLFGSFVITDTPAQAQPTDFFEIVCIIVCDVHAPSPFPGGPLQVQCTDTTDPIDATTCTPATIPADLVCDIEVTFEAGGVPFARGFQCRRPEATPGGAGGGGPGGGGGGGGVECPSATQELGNEAESGNVDLSGNVLSSGDSSNQTAAPLDFGNTGSQQNAQGVLQTCGSTADDAELSGGSMEISPVLDTASNQGVGESSASQQG